MTGAIPLQRRFPLAALIALASLLAVGMPAQAIGGTRVQHLKGSCEALTVAGRPATRGCRAALVNLTYTGGTMSFVFTDRSGRLVSFFGRIAHRSGSQTTVKVGQITLIPRGGTDIVRLAATGSCVLTPFAADRARLECAARARGQAFSGLFKTSGKGAAPITL